MLTQTVRLHLLVPALCHSMPAGWLDLPEAAQQ
jgi:hypothetical protein